MCVCVKKEINVGIMLLSTNNIIQLLSMLRRRWEQMIKYHRPTSGMPLLSALFQSLREPNKRLARDMCTRYVCVCVCVSL